MKDFYNQINNNYINISKLEKIKNDYKDLYISLKQKRKKTLSEKQFLYNYKNIESFVDKTNELYIKKIRSSVPILDNINGYPLDDYQSRVVLSNEKSTLVIAGAGSGKSLTIIGKIVYLVKHCNINPEDILCISFTNDATINLKNNIAKNYNFNINIYTFHKLALEILNQNSISYLIAPDNYLNSVIDTFFENIIPQNKLYKKCLSILLSKKQSNKEIINLKRLINTFISLFKSNNYDIKHFLTILKKIKYTINYKNYIRNKCLLLLIINIYIMYEYELSKENSLDFNDMINKSISILKSHGIKKKWKYIIIDEYQDTSLTKFNMINELMKITNANLLAVGDDFQSIYRFTGCDLHIFLNFTKYFKESKIMKIVNTYRNPQELINVAGSFVMKNKLQIKKQLFSNKHLDYPIRIYYSNNRVSILKKIISLIKDKEILVLGRNNKDINNYIDDEFKMLNPSYYEYKNIKFRYLTIHRSKGLEADNVILINMEDNLLGLPSKIKDEKILKYVNNSKDYYPFEEERRLFYVALTRTKNITYIISPISNKSIFVKEIEKYKKYVQIKKR